MILVKRVARFYWDLSMNDSGRGWPDSRGFTVQYFQSFHNNSSYANEVK